MRLRTFAIMAVVIVLGAFGLSVWAQSLSTVTFSYVQQLGDLPPNDTLYDVNFDRYAWATWEGDLLLVDAKTLLPQNTLYERNSYNDFAFSHDGRYLAVSLGTKVDLWDTTTAALVATFEPEGSLGTAGPLLFSDDDRLLQLNSIVPAPQETRRSENDTNIIPYLWDLAAARDEDRTILPNRSDGYAFFNYRNGLVLAGNRTVIAGVPDRLLIVDAENPSEIFADIQAPSRVEQAPIQVWKSATDRFLYVQPNNQQNFVQVDTTDNSLFEIQSGGFVDSRLFNQDDDFKTSNMRRVFANSKQNDSSLLRYIFGDDFTTRQSDGGLTVILVDVLQPLTDSVTSSGLLIYTYSEANGYGNVQLVQLPETLYFRISPDRTRLMARRTTEGQPIEIYNLESGVLEGRYYPIEQDVEGRHTFAYNRDQTEILTNYQRINIETGATTLYESQYTQFASFFAFAPDNRHLITYDRPDFWRIWDSFTAALVGTYRPNVNGNVLDVSDDALTYLTSSTSQNGNPVIARYNVVSQETTETVLDTQLNGTIIPNATWTRFIVYQGDVIQVFDQEGALLNTMSSLNLPGGIQQVDWVNDEQIYVIGGNPSPQLPIYGIDYAPSGVPQCLVEAYPNDWQQFIDLWEVFNAYLSPDALHALTVKLCDNLPAQASQVVSLLTPTPIFVYSVASTPRPFVVANVPACLTSRFTDQALEYADAWRTMSAGLDEESLKALEEQLCEGLITSLGQVKATPTVDPISMGAASPTPIQDAPESVGNVESRFGAVYFINIFTGDRTVGDYLPKELQPTPARNTGLLAEEFNRQFGRYPNQSALSPNGLVYAVQDLGYSFIQIYRLGQQYDEQVKLIREATANAYTAIPNVRLVPTATSPFEYAGTLAPTLTPTITPTAIPMVEATSVRANDDTVTELCPYRNLFTLDNPPPDFDAKGRLFMDDVIGTGYVSVLNLNDGRVISDDTIPPCAYGNCNVSKDGQWLLYSDNQSLAYSRLDGSDYTEVFDFTAINYISTFSWQGDELLVGYNTYAPDNQGRPVPVTLYSLLDPETSQESPFAEPTILPTVTINTFTPQIVSLSPDEKYAVVALSYANNGQRWYMLNRETAETAYFLRTDANPVNDSFWLPNSEAFYYYTGEDWYAYDVASSTFGIAKAPQTGLVSPDQRTFIEWYYEPQERVIERILADELPVKLRLWDSESGKVTRYCIPETSEIIPGGSLLWSPNSRYVVFETMLPTYGDTFPPYLPTGAPTSSATVAPTPPNPEAEYQYREPRLLMLDTQTGSVTIIGTGLTMPYGWVESEGE